MRDPGNEVGFVHLVKQSRSSPHETFHIATKVTLNPDEKTLTVAIPLATMYV